MNLEHVVGRLDGWHRPAGERSDLDGAVLAERPVQRRKHDVQAVEAPARADQHLGAGASPHPVAADLDRDRLMAGVPQPGAHRRR